MTTWRERLAPIIAAVLDEHRDSPEPELRRALRAAWPAKHLGQRQYWPYRIWLDEIKCQRGHPTATQAAGAAGAPGPGAPVRRGGPSVSAYRNGGRRAGSTSVQPYARLACSHETHARLRDVAARLGVPLMALSNALPDLVHVAELAAARDAMAIPTAAAVLDDIRNRTKETT